MTPAEGSVGVWIRTAWSSTGPDRPGHFNAVRTNTTDTLTGTADNTDTPTNGIVDFIDNSTADTATTATVSIKTTADKTDTIDTDNTDTTTTTTVSTHTSAP